MSRINELLARVQRLEDERAIMETFSRYSHSRDYWRPEEYARVFADDGVFEIRMRDGRVLHREDGTEELLAYLETCVHPPEVYDKHLLAQPVITELTETEARIESFWVFLSDRGDGPTLIAYGTYDDHLIKDNGRWRLRERRGITESSAM